VTDFQDFDLDPFDVGPSDGIGSQDFDLDITWDNEPDAGGSARDDLMSVDDSIGVGRDAPGRRDSIHSHLLGRTGVDDDMDILSHRSKTREPSEHPFDVDVDMGLPDFEGVNLEDLGIGFDDVPAQEPIERTPGQTRASSRACTSLFACLDPRH
jgi:cohesin complex subunit SCC1